MFHINQETVMPQKISTDDGVFNISNDKHPLEGVTESNVQCEESITICCYRSVIDCLQAEVRLVIAVKVEGHLLQLRCPQENVI